MLHTTNAIVLRTTKYGETSIIANLFTELLGVQTFMINGVRKANKKGSSKSNLFVPGNILQIVAYANDQKNMNRLKEYEFAFIYKSIASSVVKNATLIFCVELISKSIHEPSPMPEAYHLLQDAALHLDKTNVEQTYNISLFFGLQLAQELGFGIHGKYSDNATFLNMAEGIFVKEKKDDAQYCSKVVSESIYNLVQCNLENVHNVVLLAPRKIILENILLFLQLHIAAIKTMRSPEILQSIFE
jgi:DNA repair protein RecO (recombination protein O)